MTKEEIIMNNEKYTELLKEVRAMLPAEVLEKLKGVVSDVEFCKILADNGIDVEEIEKKVKNSGVDFSESTVVLDNDELSNINGGWYEWVSDHNVLYECPHCHNGDRERNSRQFWASLGANFLSSQAVVIYRCRNCGHFWEMRQGQLSLLDREPEL